MNEVVRLTIIEILYLVLIISVSTLTIYLATTLARANDVLRDLKKVSGMMAGVADGVDEVKTKAVQTITVAADALIDRWGNKEKREKVDVDEE